jgi:20S proteasome subunit beta 4
VNFAAQGVCGNFILSLFDRHWKAGMNLEEAKTLVQACLQELKTRFMLSQPNFTIKIIETDSWRVEEGWGI